MDVIDCIETAPNSWEPIQRRERFAAKLHVIATVALAALVLCILVATDFR